MNVVSSIPSYYLSNVCVYDYVSLSLCMCVCVYVFLCAPQVWSSLFHSFFTTCTSMWFVERTPHILMMKREWMLRKERKANQSQSFIMIDKNQSKEEEKKYM